MPAKHLNVQYLDNRPISIRVNDDDQLTDVLNTIKSFYGKTIPSPAALIQLKYRNNDLVNDSNIVHKLKQIPEQYYLDDDDPNALILSVQLSLSSTPPTQSNCIKDEEVPVTVRKE